MFYAKIGGTLTDETLQATWRHIAAAQLKKYEKRMKTVSENVATLQLHVSGRESVPAQRRGGKCQCPYSVQNCCLCAVMRQTAESSATTA